MKLSRTVRVGSRSSPLALAQTEEILSLLRARFVDVRFDVVRLSTRGDRNATAVLTSLGRGAFVKDIELALLDSEIDFAVHSAKDVGPDIPDGLRILPAGERQDARDVLVSKTGLALMSLPAESRLGTGSPRRKAQIKAIRPDVEVLPVRGNVGTRLEKARGADYDGVVIAAAGLARLGRLSEATEFLDVEQVTPDVGQGTLVAEFREGDEEMGAMLSSIVFEDTSCAFRAERAFLDAIGGGCTKPVAAYGEIDGRRLRMFCMAATPDGERIVRSQSVGDVSEAEEIGRRAAKTLLESGASEFVQGG
ncbi:MAG: hydroxymethylbilane synthase [Dehalococcoidia bacterium]|nr:hydroxymethylbilane synthase [Dehalococcoidia bacterium]